MTVTRPRVKCTPQLVLEIKKEKEVSKNSIYQALCFYNNSAAALEIRKYALARGGVIINEEVIV